MNLNFGVPNQRKVREEKYPSTAVLTLDIDEGKKKAKRMILNTKAAEQLGLSPTASGNIVFSFDDTDPRNVKVFIGNGDQAGIPDEHKRNVSKITPKRVSDKRTYDYITKVFNLDTTVENDFVLGDKMEYNGIVLYSVSQMKTDPESSNLNSEDKSEPEDDFSLQDGSSFSTENAGFLESQEVENASK